MNLNNTQRCLIIGEGNMPVQCANILVRRGFQVLAVSSPDQPLRNWASLHNVTHLPELRDFSRVADLTEFEYLFSIINYRVLPGSLLATPRRYAINYHDALLPRFAGTYATTWAIMSGQATHGITWHVMTEGIDEGDILRQVEVPVSSQDTAASLNLKCFYTAIHAFDELVQKLKVGNESPVPQNLP